MSRYNHFLSSSDNLSLLCGLSGRLSSFASNPNWFIVVNNIIRLLLHRLRWLLLRSLSGDECNILQLYPLHNCSRGFAGMHSTSCQRLALDMGSSHLSSFRWLTSICIAELYHFLWYYLTLAFVSKRRLIIMADLDFCLGGIPDLVALHYSLSILIRASDIIYGCLRWFNLIRVRLCH
jgi:hypothetical protein